MVKVIVQEGNKFILKDIVKTVPKGKIFPNTYYCLWCEEEKPQRKGPSPGQNSGSF